MVARKGHADPASQLSGGLPTGAGPEARASPHFWPNRILRSRLPPSGQRPRQTALQKGEPKMKIKERPREGQPVQLQDFPSATTIRPPGRALGRKGRLIANDASVERLTGRELFFSK